VVLAEHAPRPGERVFAEPSRCLWIAHCVQGISERVGDIYRAMILRTEDPPRPGEGVLAEEPCGFELTEHGQVADESVGAAQGVDMVRAEDALGASESGFMQLSRSGHLAKHVLVIAELRCCDNGVRMFVTVQPSSVGKGVLVEMSGSLDLTQLAQVAGQVIDRAV
jgi:hypothetical protein